jgi:hypothetical protein
MLAFCRSREWYQKKRWVCSAVPVVPSDTTTHSGIAYPRQVADSQMRNGLLTLGCALEFECRANEGDPSDVRSVSMRERCGRVYSPGGVALPLHKEIGVTTFTGVLASLNGVPGWSAAGTIDTKATAAIRERINESPLHFTTRTPECKGP